jgi:hypothetical protein
MDIFQNVSEGDLILPDLERFMEELMGNGIPIKHHLETKAPRTPKKPSCDAFFWL